MITRSRPFSDAEYVRLADFRHAMRRYHDFSSKAARAEGLTPQQHQALLAIRGNSEAHACVGRLAERLCVRHHTAVGLAQRLEQAGFISRLSSETDRRSVVLTLTAEGEAKLEVLTQAHRRELRHIGPQLRALVQELNAEDPA